MSRCKECGRSVFLSCKSIAGKSFCSECGNKIFALPWEHLVKKLWPEEDFILCGEAYWDTLRSRLTSGGLRTLFFGLLGPLGLGGPEWHRWGIIGISQGDLVVIDLGGRPGEYLTERVPFPDRPKIVRAPLVNLSGTAEQGHLSVSGDIEMVAVFPPSAGLGNPSKADAIAQAVQQALFAAGGDQATLFQ